MPFTGPREDHLLIRELYGRYADASWRGDREEWLRCFTGEARWASHIFDCSGADDLRNQWDILWADWDNVAFLTDIGSLEVSGDTAQARSYAREIVQLKNGGIFKLSGRYDDTIVRQDGDWLFASRTYFPMILEAPE